MKIPLMLLELNKQFREQTERLLREAEARIVKWPQWKRERKLFTTTCPVCGGEGGTLVEGSYGEWIDCYKCLGKHPEALSN